MTYEIVGLVVLLLLSGFFSSSEFAFVLANKIKIELRARKENFAAKNAHYYISNPNIFFSTILISNNIVNIAFSSLVAYFIANYYQLGEFQILVISTVLLLFIGELIPKYLAREIADSFILFASLPIRVITFIFYPIVKLTSSLSSILVKTDGSEEEEEISTFDKEEFQTILSESNEAGHVAKEEFDVLNTILDMREQKVNDVMTPRTEIVGVDIHSTVADALKLFIESGYSKLPVYEENLDNIKGIVITYDMFTNPQDLNSVMREVIFVPETKQIIDTLNELLAKSMSITIVVDEFGGTAGIVTVEDIIEEMLGEIRDEYDVDEDVCRKVNDNSFVLAGKIEVDYLNEEYELNIPEGDYATIGGYITNNIGRIPIKNEIVRIERFSFQIIRSDKTKIDLVKLTIEPE